MVIEGYEYEVFAEILKRNNNLPYQLSFETHFFSFNTQHTLLHPPRHKQLYTAECRFLSHEPNGWYEDRTESPVLRLFC